jgi:hypothetical protein
MRNRHLLATALLFAPVFTGGAQTTRWNDRSTERLTDDAPAVSVWFEDSRQMRFGSSPRVRFRVEEDAYVVIGRVDSDGRMTILFPYNRTTRSFVRGGTDNIVRSRRGGTTYSFTTYERWGIGFVFAIASYEPLDFSRLQNRDFDSDIGVANAIARRYTGNPRRVVEKFAPWVLWDQNTPYEYDIVSYSVETPTYASYSSFCGGGAQYGNYYDLYDQSYCNSAYGYYGLFCSGYLGYGSALCYDPYFGRFGYRGGTIATGPRQPPTTPSGNLPNTKLIPQIRQPGEDGKINGGQRALELPTRPTVGGTAGDDELDRIYSIPRRALDDMRRQEVIERRPIGEIAGGAGTAEGGVTRPTLRDGSDARPNGEGRPAGGRRGERGEDRPLGTPGRQDRGRDRDNPTPRGENPRNDPPPRESPRNDNPPARDGDTGGGRLGGSGGRAAEPPPRSYDPPRRSEPRNDPGPRSSGGGRGDGGRSAQPSSPPPRPREAATERKPAKPEKP